VLDVGCGVGLNGAAAKRTGARVTGIEIVPPPSARAKEVLDEVLSIDITDAEAVRRASARARSTASSSPTCSSTWSIQRRTLARLLPHLGARTAR